MGKRLGILIALLTAAAVAGCVFLRVARDNEGPVIEFTANVPTYYGNPDDKDLLSNVTAMDKKDGDVSNTLFVDSVRVSEDGTRAKVTYVALDRSSNVSRVSQVLSCKTGSRKTEDSRKDADAKNEDENVKDSQEQENQTENISEDTQQVDTQEDTQAVEP